MKNKTKYNLATFLHAAYFSPDKLTLLKVIRNKHFNTWLGMEYNFVQKHITDNVHTSQGHLNQERRGLQSKKIINHDIFQKSDSQINKDIEGLKKKANISQPMAYIIHLGIIKYAFPSSEEPNNKINEVAYVIVEVKPKNVAYIDFTGRFPYRSSRGNKYILVGYHYGDNAISAESLKNRKLTTITEA